MNALQSNIRPVGMMRRDNGADRARLKNCEFKECPAGHIECGLGHNAAIEAIRFAD
jgi:hypothetical protein